MRMGGVFMGRVGRRPGFDLGKTRHTPAQGRLRHALAQGRDQEGEADGVGEESRRQQKGSGQQQEHAFEQRFLGAPSA